MHVLDSCPNGAYYTSTDYRQNRIRNGQPQLQCMMGNNVSPQVEFEYVQNVITQDHKLVFIYDMYLRFMHQDLSNKLLLTFVWVIQ